MKITCLNSIGWYNMKILEANKEYIKTVHELALMTTTIKSSIVLNLISSFNKVNSLRKNTEIEELKSRLKGKEEEIQRLKSRNLIQRILNT